jgi:hypothetical protein
MMLLISFFQVTTSLNILVSSLNTNANVRIRDFQAPSVAVELTTYLNKDAGRTSSCHLTNLVSPAGFYSLPYDQSSAFHGTWPPYSFWTNNSQLVPSAVVEGFFGGCTPLDALLASTLDCLHNTTCLELLHQYFPALNQVPLILSSVSETFFSLEHFRFYQTPPISETRKYFCT